MEYDKNICPVVDVDGVITTGKQFDLDITLPKDNRNVIFGVIRDFDKEPVRDAVVKLIEVVKTHCGKEERTPVSHTFTDKDGEFVFGPLCPDKFYEIQIWVNEVKHKKICVTRNHKMDCLKGVDIDCKKNNECEPCQKYDEHKNDEKKCEKSKDYDYKYDEENCDEHKNYECKPCEKKCEEHKEYDYKDDEKKCKEHKDHECKPCEKKCEEYKEPDYKPYPMRPFSYRR